MAETALLDMQCAELLASRRLNAEAPDLVAKVVKWVEDTCSKLSAVEHVSDIAPLRVFLPPVSVSIIGSHAARLPVASVDIAFQIPKECFFQKDFLDGRYLQKRTAYVHHLHQMLSQASGLPEGKWLIQPLRKDDAKPVLVWETKLAGGVVFRLVPVIDPTTFDVKKLASFRGCLHRKDSEKQNRVPAPLYSSAVLEDMFMVSHADLMQSLLAGAHGGATRDGTLLFRIWLKQRDLDAVRDGFSGFLGTMMACYLLQHQQLNDRMTAMQVFRVILGTIVKGDMLSNGIFWGSGKVDQGDLSTREVWRRDVVFVDPSGHLNLTACMTAASYTELREEAQMTFESFREDAVGAFRQALLVPVGARMRFDDYVWVAGKRPEGVQDDCIKQYLEPSQTEQLAGLLQRALGSRGRSVRALHCGRLGAVVLGLQLNDEHLMRALDIGPNAEDEAACRDFRDFWGDKAELRRFKDGSVMEVVVWDMPQNERCRLVQELASHIFQRHCNVSGADVRSLLSVHQGCGHVPRLHGGEKRSRSDEGREVETSSASGSCVLDSDAVFRAFDALSAQLRSLEGLPLVVTALRPAHPAFCYAGVVAPASRAGLPPLDVVVVLESTGRWPDEIEAINHVKTAFLLKISQRLAESHGVQSSPTSGFLDVFGSSGVVFRLWIHGEFELSLVKRIGDATNVERQFVWRPQHIAAVRTLCQRHRACRPALRLTKQWVHTEMLSDVVPEEAVELLVAHVFCHPTPFVVPRTGVTALRRVLWLLEWHPWADEPLVVDLEGQMDAEARKDIQRQFQATRRQGGGASLYLATADDPLSRWWTMRNPNEEVLRRLVVCARHFGRRLNNWMTAPVPPLEIQFEPKWDAFDVIIWLTSVHAPVQPKFRNVGFPVVGHDPVRCYFVALGERFGSLALFFWNLLDGRAIGVVWRPSAFLPTAIRPAVPCPCMLDGQRSGIADAEAKGVPNVAVLLADMVTLGGDLVRRAQVL